MPPVVGVGVNDVPIVGEPVAYGTGFIAFLLVCFSRYLALPDIECMGGRERPGR